MSLDYKKANIKLAKTLRKNSTPQEKRLWYDFLRKYDVRFQRQKAIDNYIADFYSHKAKLIIELDGSGHCEAEQARKDAQRTAYLEDLGLKVLRFSNLDVDKNFYGVCTVIDNEVAARR